MGVGTFMSTLWNAGKAGWSAAQRVFDDPMQNGQYRYFYQRINEYNLLWSYYNNSAFDKVARFMNVQNAGLYGRNLWDQYKANYNLRRNIREIHNPVEQLVDFYASQVYPGILTIDGAKLPDGVPMAIPLSANTTPELKAAIGQIWQWSNWQAKKTLEVRYGAALGSVLVEVVDDLDHAKVYLDVLWPGKVTHLKLDSAGNVTEYHIAFYTYDDVNGQYFYKKEVDKKSFRYFKNNKLFDYGNGAVVPNIYGFVPAVWIKHNDMGGEHGAPAVRGSMAIIDELNNLVSGVDDQINKVIGAPLLIATSGNITNLFGAQKRGPTSDFPEPTSDTESLLMLRGPADSKVQSLAGNLDLAGAETRITGLLTEVERRFPEITYYEKLAQMTQVTGPGASRIMGNVEKRVIDVQAAYDTPNTSLFRMAVAIAGMRASSGAWGPLSRQQQKFQFFDLDSYERGDLEMEILPRPLLTPTKLETAQEEQIDWTAAGIAVQNAGVPIEWYLKHVKSYSDERIAELQAAQLEKEAQIQRDQALAQEDVVPAQEQ